MHLKKLYVRHFRNHKETLLDFCPQINLFYGDNAQGKTSILEAIHVLMIGRSFRTSQASDLIREGEKAFSIEAHFIREEVDQTLKIWNTGKERRIVYNSTEYSSLINLLGLLPGVVMTPDDELVKGSPQSRRQFLDIQISQADPFYVHSLSRYQRAMRQRNLLLRSENLETIEMWEEEMAAAAAYVTQKRESTVSDLQHICRNLYPVLGNMSEELTIAYQMKPTELFTHSNRKEAYFELFKKNRQREIALGNTLYGPHRDELDILINGKEARSFGSEGQKRTCVAVLRLASWELLKKRVDENPLLLIDDMGISLDDNRLHKLMEYLQRLGQVFITSAQPQERFSAFSNSKRLFPIVQGKALLSEHLVPVSNA